MFKRNALAGAAIFALVVAAGLTTGGATNAATPTTVPLGTASSFAVLAGAGVTNTGPTTIKGDVGTYATTTETGFGSVTLTGTNHAGDAVTQGAKTDLTTAYLDAAGRGPTIPVVADLGGLTLVPGVYNSGSSIGLTGTVTLAGSSTDVWIFQAGSTLTTASGSKVVLTGGAQSCNVFWQVGSSATLGTGSSFIGTVLALSSITVTTGAAVDGRVLARNGAVTLDTNTITASGCATAPSTPTPSTPTPSTPTPSTPTPSTPAQGGGPNPFACPGGTTGVIPFCHPFPTLTPPTPSTSPAVFPNAPSPTQTPTSATPTPATPAPSPTVAGFQGLPSTSTSGGSPILGIGLMVIALVAAVVVYRQRRLRIR